MEWLCDLVRHWQEHKEVYINNVWYTWNNKKTKPLHVFRSLSMKNDDIFFFDINRRTEIHRDSPSKTWGVRAGFGN
jgi:uncharacterized ferritin-like protein (DUF455 family)